MAQSTIIELPNNPKTTKRGDLNELIKACYTGWSGGIEPIPSPTGSNPKSAPYMTWDDTDNKQIKKRNASDTDWYIFLDYSNLTLLGSGGKGFKPFERTSDDIEITSTGQTLFTVGEEYKAGSLLVFRNGVLIKIAYVTESDQSTNPGEFTLDSDYISDNPFDTTYEEISVVYDKYI